MKISYYQNNSVFCWIGILVWRKISMHVLNVNGTSTLLAMATRQGRCVGGRGRHQQYRSCHEDGPLLQCCETPRGIAAIEQPRSLSNSHIGLSTQLLSFSYNNCPIVLAICNGSLLPINRQKKSTNKSNIKTTHQFNLSNIGYDTVQNDYIWRWTISCVQPSHFNMGILINFISFHETKWAVLDKFQFSGLCLIGFSVFQNNTSIRDFK